MSLFGHERCLNTEILQNCLRNVTPIVRFSPLGLTQLPLKTIHSEKIRIKTMAFINRWKISQNWERNVKASDSAI